MSFELVFTRRAKSDIEVLDAVVRKQLGRKLTLLQAQPFAVSKKLVHSTIGSYRYRVGDYRVVFDVEGERIVVLRVGHRREIYR